MVKSKTKILYLIHIDWAWIKQRPQFLAEELSKKFDIEIFARYSFSRFTLSKAQNEKLNIHNIFHIPGCSKVCILNNVNNFLTSLYFLFQIKKCNPDFIWITAPELINFIPKQYRRKVIYDCMDDYISLIKNKKTMCDEQITVKNAKLIFASSLSLIMKLNKRYKLNERKIHLIRNAFDGEIINAGELKKRNDKFRICYIGTIGEWFDFELVKKILDVFYYVEFELIGPVIVKNAFMHERVHYHGTVEHDELYSAIKNFDCLIMPFILNSIVESVDPVKLYEYINFGKNIICKRYDEIKRFEEYVYFYNEHEEVIDLIEKLYTKNECKYTIDEKVKFLEENSWEVRAIEIANILNRLKSERQFHGEKN